MNETYIAALEIGSSKITGAVGVYDGSTLKVLACAQEESRDSVRYGIINNPEEVAAKVNRIVEKLEANPAVAPRKITGFYVGLSGRSMRSIKSDVKLIYPEETEITTEILHNLRQDATQDVQLDSNQEILGVVPRMYQIDGLETATPKGAMGKQICAEYDVIIGRNELKRNIHRALAERTGLSIKGLILTALASADVVLTNDDKRLGCMMVDFGAETTTVCIYRNGSLCYFATLPLGSRNITRDLTTLNILEERAEEIKIESGKAIARETPSTLNINNIRLSDVSNLVVARAEEIVANVVQQISYAGLKEKDLPVGIVCIGAGAYLNGLLELLEVQSGLNARMGHLPADIQAVDAKAKRHDSIQAAAILFAGARKGEECLQLPEPEVDDTADEPLDEQANDEKNEKEGKVGKFFRKMSSWTSNIFNSGIDEDSELD